MHSGPPPGLFRPCREGLNTLTSRREHPRPRTPGWMAAGTEAGSEDFRQPQGAQKSGRRWGWGRAAVSGWGLRTPCTVLLFSQPSELQCPRNFLLLQVLPSTTPLSQGPAQGPARGPTGGGGGLEQAQGSQPSHTFSAGRLTYREASLSQPPSVCQAPTSHLQGFADGLVFPWGVKEPVIAGASSPLSSWLWLPRTPSS